MKKILIEASVIEQDAPTGVNYFTIGLAGALEKIKGLEFNVGYFWLNFFGRKQPKNKLMVAAKKESRLQLIRLIPQKVYAKLVYYSVAPPLPLVKADWILYPNFYVWPSFGESKKAVVIHDVCYLRHPEYVEDKNQAFLSRVVNKAIMKSDKIVVMSDFTKNEVMELLGVDENRIIKITIPVNQETLAPDLNLGKQRLADRYGITKPYIMTLGTLEPRKNLEDLVNAYCLLPEAVRDEYSLVLAGKWGWKTEGLRALIEDRLQQGFDIITTNHIDGTDKATLYYQASAFALTTHYEGFGMPLLEAMYCGIPTVAVDIPVLKEVGQDGCLWAEKTPESVCTALATILTNQDYALTLSQKGKAVAQGYSWDATAKTLAQELELLD